MQEKTKRRSLSDSQYALGKRSFEIKTVEEMSKPAVRLSEILIRSGLGHYLAEKIERKCQDVLRSENLLNCYITLDPYAEYMSDLSLVERKDLAALEDRSFDLENEIESVREDLESEEKNNSDMKDDLGVFMEDIKEMVENGLIVFPVEKFNKLTLDKIEKLKKKHIEE